MEVYGKLIDIFSREIYGAKVVICNGKIESIERKKESDIRYFIMPGLIDAHTHICASTSKYADMLGIEFLDRKVGGISGGGSHITPSGKVFMRNYEKFRAEIEKVLEKTYQKHFGK